MKGCAGEFMTRLTIRPTAFHYGLQTGSDDDCIVLDGEEVVGRIYRTRTSPESWTWALSPLRAPRFPYGDAGSREAAIAAFQAAFDMNEANSEEGTTLLA